MVDMFIRRKHGEEEIEYPHPSARGDPRGHLRLHRLPGAGDADLEHLAGSRSTKRTTCARRWARRSPRSCRSSRSSSSRARWRTAAPKASRAEIWDNIVKFGGYGFNKSHSTAYALIMNIPSAMSVPCLLEPLFDERRNVLDALGDGDTGRLHALDLVGRRVGLALDDGAGVPEAHAGHLVHEPSGHEGHDGSRDLFTVIQSASSASMRPPGSE